MCHPGYPDALLEKTGTRLLAQREIECRALMSPEIKHLVGSEGIQLIGYGELVRVRGEAMARPDIVVGTAAGYERRLGTGGPSI
jgi:hypothetical protein